MPAAMKRSASRRSRSRVTKACRRARGVRGVERPVAGAVEAVVVRRARGVVDQGSGWRRRPRSRRRRRQRVVVAEHHRRWRSASTRPRRRRRTAGIAAVDHLRVRAARRARCPPARPALTSPAGAGGSRDAIAPSVSTASGDVRAGLAEQRDAELPAAYAGRRLPGVDGDRGEVVGLAAEAGAATGGRRPPSGRSCPSPCASVGGPAADIDPRSRCRRVSGLPAGDQLGQVEAGATPGRRPAARPRRPVAPRRVPGAGTRGRARPATVTPRGLPVAKAAGVSSGDGDRIAGRAVAARHRTGRRATWRRGAGAHQDGEEGVARSARKTITRSVSRLSQQHRIDPGSTMRAGQRPAH